MSPSVSPCPGLIGMRVVVRHCQDADTRRSRASLSGGGHTEEQCVAVGMGTHRGTVAEQLPGMA